MMKCTMILALLASSVFAAPGEKKAPPAMSNKDKLAVIDAVRPSFVHVEYTMKFDKGEEPRGGSWGSFARYIKQERPMETSGLLIDAKTVIVDDLMMHPRFMKSISVVYRGGRTSAKVSGFAMKQNVMYLELDKPLKGAKPAKFDASLPGPYLNVRHSLSANEWVTTAYDAPKIESITVTDSGEKFMRVPRFVVDAKGRPVGVSTVSRVGFDAKWKGSPLDWEKYSSAEMDKKLKSIEKLADGGIFRVALNFRSPKKDFSSSSDRYSSRSEDEGTEKNAVGLLIDKKTVLVLGNYKPKITARLATISVYPPNASEPVGAKFSHTLRDYGCLIATLDKPLKGALKFSKKDVTSLRYRLLAIADVKLQGEKRVVYYGHRRITSFSLGWKRHVYPGVSERTGNAFLFDDDGALVIFPLARRPKVSSEDRYGGGEVLATPTTQITPVLANLASNVDPNNVPLAAADENRLAWLGVVLQPLNRELARANNVSDLTRDGQIGAVVSYVYPGSPAAKAGVEMSWIMLNIQVDGDPRPIDIKAREYAPGANFPWKRWDELPARYWDGKFPTPWQPTETFLTRKLTDMGFGKKFTATFFADGKQVKKKFTVVSSPTHYHTAAKFKSEKVGLTVREMTYEVRRYFLKTAKDPGVIVSSVEPGSKAGVGGVRPFEIITHVNDQPVNSVKEFEKAIKGKDELRLSVLRMTKNRLVKLRMTGGATSTTKPSK
jgi:serine protease Do